jgi:hypothetical protein
LGRPDAEKRTASIERDHRHKAGDDVKVDVRADTRNEIMDN